ncbi:hypothetical protein ABPG72_020704 [Tetrahymena utriculariae]
MLYIRQKQNIQLKYDSTVNEVCWIVQQFQSKSEKSQRALCCLLGSYAGDNLGNYNEFWKSINEQEIEEALKMNGQGTHGLLPGQSTDDTELATSLGFGLVESLNKGVMNLDMIAKYYTCWYHSQPFDIGTTTRQAFQSLNDVKINYETSYMDYIYNNFALEMKTSSYNNNISSKSNGGLMRIAPLVVYLCQIDNQDMIKKAVYEEQSLTHPNQTCLECSYIFTRACIQLIQTGDAMQTFDTINKYIKNECPDQEIQYYWNNHVLQEKPTNAIENQGYVFHAFTMAFIFLKQFTKFNLTQQSQQKPNLFIDKIRKAISQCGDSDTNAAICGTLLGSLLNLNEFPQIYLLKIIQCDLQNSKQPLLKHVRPFIYNPRNCIYLCNLLLQLGPSSEHSLLIYPQNIDELKKDKRNNNNQNIKFQEQKIIQLQNEKLYQLNIYDIKFNGDQNQTQNQKIFNNNQHLQDQIQNQNDFEQIKQYQQQNVQNNNQLLQQKQTSNSNKPNAQSVQYQNKFSIQNNSFQQEEQTLENITQKQNKSFKLLDNQGNDNYYQINKIGPSYVNKNQNEYQQLGVINEINGNCQQDLSSIKNNTYKPQEQNQIKVNNQQLIDYYKLDSNQNTNANNKKGQSHHQTEQINFQNNSKLGINKIDDPQFHEQQQVLQKNAEQNNYFNGKTNFKGKAYTVQGDFQQTLSKIQQPDQLKLLQQQQAEQEYLKKLTKFQSYQNYNNFGEITQKQVAQANNINFLENNVQRIEQQSLKQNISLQPNIRQNKFDNMTTSKIQQHKSLIPSNYRYFDKQ